MPAEQPEKLVDSAQVADQISDKSSAPVGENEKPEEEGKHC